MEHRISEHEARQLTLLWLWEAEKRAAGVPLGQAVADREEAMAQLDADEVILIDPMDEQRLGAATEEAGRLLRDYGVSLEREDPMYRFLAGLLGRAMLEMTRRARDHMRGDMSGRSHDPLSEGVTSDSPKPSGKGDTRRSVILVELCDMYVEWPGRPRSVLDLRAAFRPMLEVLGQDTPARDVTLADMRRVYELMVRLPSNATKRWRGLKFPQVADRAEREGVPPLGPRTCNGDLTKLRNLFDWAQAEGVVESNPVSKNLRVAATRRSRRHLREAFDREQLEVDDVVEVDGLSEKRPVLMVFETEPNPVFSILRGSISSLFDVKETQA